MNFLCKKKGFLEIHTGCVKSGKTDTLYSIHRTLNYYEACLTTVYYTFDSDILKEYDSVWFNRIKYKYIKKSSDINPSSSTRNIVIDRAHLFTDNLFENIIKLLENFNVIIFSQSCDHNNIEYEQITYLINRADLHLCHIAYCNYCRRHNANITIRTGHFNKERIFINIPKYVPVCDECYQDKKQDPVLWNDRNIIYNKYIDENDAVIIELYDFFFEIDLIKRLVVKNNELIFLHMITSDDNKFENTINNYNNGKYKDLLKYIKYVKDDID